MAGFPMAPAEDPVGRARPGVATSAAVLGFAQAGITAITTAILIVGVTQTTGTEAAFNLILGVVQLVGVILLMFGGVQLMQGKGRGMLIGADVAEIVIAGFWAVAFVLVPAMAFETEGRGKGVLVALAALFALMPTVSLIQSFSGGVSSFLIARRGY
jgi:hypothetical protein